MTTTTNAMAASTVQPKFVEVGNFSIVCTQAIASNAASLAAYKLFVVASDVTIVDMYLRLGTAASTAATLMNVGITTNGSDFIASYATSTIVLGRATKGLPYTCTADTPIYANLSAGDCTAASNLYVVAICAAKDNVA
jgi:hypothetical protein